MTVDELVEMYAGPRSTASVARYHWLDEGTERFEVEAGFPVAAPIAGDGEGVASSLPERSPATTLHVGPHDDLPAAYDAVASWVAARGGEPAGDR